MDKDQTDTLVKLARKLRAAFVELENLPRNVDAYEYNELRTKAQNKIFAAARDVAQHVAMSEVDDANFEH